MGRVLDIHQLAGIQVGQGFFTVRVTDADCPWNEGIWSLASNDGVLQVDRSEEDFDGILSIQGLSALVYGAHDPLDFAFRGWGSPSPDLVLKMRALFPPMQPYLHEFF
jgi:predicted acetyltransferase